MLSTLEGFFLTFNKTMELMMTEPHMQARLEVVRGTRKIALKNINFLPGKVVYMIDHKFFFFVLLMDFPLMDFP